MDASPALTLERQLAATLAWWREAGVEHVFADAPRAWLREAVETPAAPAAPPSAAPAEPAPPPAAIGGPAEGWPRDLAAFRAWWLAEPSLDFGGSGPRVPPHGEAEPALMVLVPMPEAEDRETLLAGREGRLVARMLAAMGIAPADAYLAAALPRRMPRPDWDGLAQAGLGAVLKHQLALVRPQRLLVLGHGILPLLGHARAQASATIELSPILGVDKEMAVPMLPGLAPDLLLGNARQRAALWRQWLDWTGTDA